MHKTFKFFSTKILVTFLKFFSIFATSSCQKTKISPKRSLFYFYLHFCFCFTISGFEGYLRKQWAKQSVPSEIPHRLRLALCRRVILSSVEIRAKRGSNNAKRCLDSTTKKFDSASLHSGWHGRRAQAILMHFWQPHPPQAVPLLPLEKAYLIVTSNYRLLRFCCWKKHL